MRRALLLLLLIALPSSALAQSVCYRRPFGNPNLRDGWGSTAGRTNPHRGVDFPQASGTNIPAVAAGVVRLRTSSGCLGNVVVIEHADGMFSGYAHMLSGSPLAEGTRVAMGQTIGRVGSTGSCTTGPHLHLTMSRTVGGYGSGTTIDPIPYIDARTTCVTNTAPRGYLDAAGCGGISGWAQDQDAPAAAIDVHVYIGGPAGDPAAHSFAVKADLSRNDLCTAIGSCPHGFGARVPLAFFDGVDRPVYAYGIDSAGGANTLLAHSPRTLRCDAAPLPDLAVGRVRRHVPSPEVMAAWKLALTDIAPLSDATLAAVDAGPPLSAAPQLVRIDGADAVYVREGRVLRHVQSPAVMTAWRFDFAAIRTVTAAEIEGDLEGAPWLAAPFLSKGTKADVYAIDAAPPLWAELVGDDVPARMTVGSAFDATLRLANRGSLAWTDAVELVTTPPSTPSPLCDAASWASCTRVGTVASEVAPGAEGAIAVRLRAPDHVGPAQVCFGMVLGTHAFSDLVQGGPADGAWCRTVEVVAAGVAGTPDEETPDVPGGAALPAPIGPGTVGEEADAEKGIAGGCATTEGQGAGAMLVLLGLIAGRALRRRS